MQRAPLMAFTLLVFATFSSSQRTSAANISDFPDFSLLDGGDNVLLPGRLHTPAPPATNPHQPRPLILYLHGSGQSGTDNTNHIIQTDLNNLVAAARKFGFLIYAPQTNSGWSSSTVLSRAMTMIDRAIAERNVDPTRIYVTGLSMGGGGVWNFLNSYSDRFAAAAPICAVGPAPGFRPANLVDEPIWAFHARNDSVVPVTESRHVVDALLAEAREPLPAYPDLNDAGANFTFDSPRLDLRYTEYAVGGHVIWPNVYASKPLYDWMLAHTSVPETTPAVLILLCAVVLSSAHRAPFGNSLGNASSTAAADDGA